MRTGVASQEPVLWPTFNCTSSGCTAARIALYRSRYALWQAVQPNFSIGCGLLASTTYHFQVLSTDAQGNAAISGDFTFTTSAAGVGPQLLLQLHADATEVSGLTNGSTVTPGIAPAGFNGAVVVKGTGSANFTPAQVGNGVYFLNCCANTNNAYYKFTGATVGNIFNVNQGQISFYLKSRYSFTQRQTTAAGVRGAFDVLDDQASRHLFYFITQVSSGSLLFSYTVGSGAQFYYVPRGTEDTLFGNGSILKVTITWDGSVSKLYLNDTQVQSSSYTKPTPNWTATSVFDLGAIESAPYGGYNSSDDVIDEFTVTGP